MAMASQLALHNFASEVPQISQLMGRRLTADITVGKKVADIDYPSLM
jgi:hypothetical protein